jgi:hypothetical protein
MRFIACSAVLACSLALAACGRAGRDDSPIATVRHFLEVMDRSADEDDALAEAYRLLDDSAQGALAQRALRTGMLSGRDYQPWQMLAPGRFALHFAPASPGGMHERVNGDTAVVTVTGDKPGQRAEVPLVRQHGKWRIKLVIPPMRNAASSGARQTDG